MNGVDWPDVPAEEPSACGLCVYAADVGVYVAGNPVAYVNPTCPDHSEDARTEKEQQ